MKIIIQNTIVCSAILALALGSISTHAKEEGWAVESRSLPVSVDVSEQYREILLNTPAPDIAAAKNNVPQTVGQWEALIDSADAQTLTAARKMAKALSVTVKHDLIAGVNVYHVMPPEISPEHQMHLFLHVHGGAYILNGGEAGTFEAILIASHLKMPVLSIDYRMPPKHPAPAAMEDVVVVWKELLKERSSTSIAMGGTSGGAGLTMSSVQRFKELGLALPQALLLGTPGADAGKVGDSRYINEGIDSGLVAWDGLIEQAMKMYSANFEITHPYVSPVYGNFEGFPPSYLISGTRDLMLSDTIRVHRKLRRAGVEADLHVYEGQSHADYLKFMNIPESSEHFKELNAFLMKHFPRVLLDRKPFSNDALRKLEVPKTAVY
jgi:epsilon-lactone hydrolase